MWTWHTNLGALQLVWSREEGSRHPLCRASNTNLASSVERISTLRGVSWQFLFGESEVAVQCVDRCAATAGAGRGPPQRERGREGSPASGTLLVVVGTPCIRMELKQGRRCPSALGCTPVCTLQLGDDIQRAYKRWSAIITRLC